MSSSGLHEVGKNSNSQKEQFAAANKIIEKENSCIKNNIETMESSDKIVANQIQEFNDGLRLLTSHLSNARQDFTKFSAETKTRGKFLKNCVGFAWV